MRYWYANMLKSMVQMQTTYLCMTFRFVSSKKTCHCYDRDYKIGLLALYSTGMIYCHIMMGIDALGSS